MATDDPENVAWTIPEGCSALVQTVAVHFSAGGLTLVLERHPSTGEKIPARIELLFPAPVARPMLEGLREVLDGADKPEWMKSH